MSQSAIISLSIIAHSSALRGSSERNITASPMLNSEFLVQDLVQAGDVVSWEGSSLQ